MIKRTGLRSIYQSLCLVILSLFSSLAVRADGGYFAPPQSIAVSSDQRAVIWQSGDRIGMALSTAYTGDGEEFAWIIPTPEVPLPGSVAEGGELVEEFFGALDQLTAPKESHGGGCFPAGTPVLTASGLCAIESVAAGTEVVSYDIEAGGWDTGYVVRPLSHEYSGDLVTIRCAAFSLNATGNHPFYVVSGEQLHSRPPAADVPPGERRASGPGRWVSARDLAARDVLLTRNRGLQEVMELSRSEIRATVYNLEISGMHNYAVGAAGVLVHNKGSAESGGSSPSPAQATVSVHESLDLEHYHAEVLSSTSGTDLFSWLRENGYQVDESARDLLESYVNRGWSFVAIRLQPGEQRKYRNEFLPPVVVRYRSDELVFPLLISSASTTENIRLSLFVIAESTVRSANFPTRHLQYDSHFKESLSARQYIERRIERTSGHRGQRLTVLWSGRLDTYGYAEIIAEGGHAALPELRALFSGRDPPGDRWDEDLWLTRLEGRMGPSAMTDDIELRLQREPETFRVRVRPGSREYVTAFRFEPAWNLGQDAAARGFAPRAGLSLGLTTLGGYPLLMTTNVFYQHSPDAGRWAAGADLGINIILASLSPRVLVESIDSSQDVWLGFSAGFFDIPAVIPLYPFENSDVWLGIGVGAFSWSTMWNARTGERRSSIGCLRIAVGTFIW